MQREQAKQELAGWLLKELDEQSRRERIAFWFFCGFSEADPQLAALPPALRMAVMRGVEPDDTADPDLDPLVHVSLVEDLYGVTNAYLVQALNQRGITVAQIEGNPEPMFACPCCGYFSLSSSASYEICSVCFWEDDGVRDEHTVSGPNQATLATARQNLAEFGACDLASVDRVDRQARERYRAPEAPGD